MNNSQLIDNFIKVFKGETKEIRIFSSPGRVNLIGEHTDYNGGYVFPAALTMNSTAIIRPRKDRIIKLKATDLDFIVEASLDNLELYKDLKWGNYQLGVANELQKEGYDLIGCEILYHDTVPIGSGLSSSAAIEVVTALALVEIAKRNYQKKELVNMIELAKICQMAEHNYIGVKCGIMDQFASAMGKKNHAIFLDCKTLNYKHILINMKGYTIVIANTKVKRSLGAVKYNERRDECNEGLLILQKKLIDKKCLGDISVTEFEDNKELLKDEIIRKRVKHVIYEDDRVICSIKALKDGNIREFGKLINESHNSLKNDYEVTGFELDTMVEEARKINGVIGSRMTGAGFGGCTVSIVKDDAVKEFIKKVGKRYTEKTGIKGEFYISEIGDGGSEILV